MSSAVPHSPNVVPRRKGPKSLPRLPLSAFTPPNSGTGEKFPLPPSPGSVLPAKVIDAHVIAPGGNLDKWRGEAEPALGDKLSGVAVSLHGTEPSQIEGAIQSLTSSASKVPIVAILVPYSLESGAPTNPPAYLAPKPAQGPPIVLYTVYTKFSTRAVEALRWALEQGFTVDMDIETSLRAGEGAWEDIQELLTKAIPENPKGKIILSNILPPPDDLNLPIVKLLNHPTYRDYQTQSAALSLYANVAIKFIPPVWNAATPTTPAPTAVSHYIEPETPIDSPLPTSLDTKEQKEWKRRIKMYIGPALEAFGYQRIIFGSSPSPSSRAQSNAGDWYELARESFAELGIEQEGVDAIFFENAQKVYGS